MAHQERDSEAPESRVRLDVWLWATRFFKTRALAHDAVEGGKVTLDGARAKPGKAIIVGQKISIKSPRGDFDVTVLGLSTKRLGAPLAAELYQETEESRLRREQLAEQKSFVVSTAPAERPNSQDRERIRRLKES